MIGTQLSILHRIVNEHKKGILNPCKLMNMLHNGECCQYSCPFVGPQRYCTVSNYFKVK